MAFFDYLAKLGASLTDIFSKSGETLGAVSQGADKLYGWDQSEGKATAFSLGTNLSTTGGTLNAAGGSGDVATDAIWDAKGDLAVGTGANTASRLAAGADGTFLKARAGATAGAEWDYEYRSRFHMGGRLTLESGVPVSTTDQTAKGTLYYTPAAVGGPASMSDLVWLYTSSVWTPYVFTERSLSLTLTDAKNYDVFLYDNSGTLTLALSAAWTTDTARADALALQDGIVVKSGATNYRWLGTIRASGTNTCATVFGGAGTAANLLVSNAYNRVRASLSALDTTDSWSYTTGTIRQKNGSSVNQLNIVSCIPQFASAINIWNGTMTAGQQLRGYIGLNATNAKAALSTGGQIIVTGGQPCTETWGGVLGSGFNYISALEYGAAGGTFYGDAGNASIFQTGLYGVVEW